MARAEAAQYAVAREVRDVDDRTLVRRARDGDRHAAHILAERHLDGAWRAAFAITGRVDLADDALQDGFERAFAKLDRFDEDRPFAPWLNRIVANRALTLVARARPTVPLDAEALACDDRRPQEARELMDAVDRLHPDRRVVVVLRSIIGFTPDETAEALGVPVGTVHSRLHRAMDDLRAALGVRAP
jgi:RNA polymerase sigma-70 factor (ECF subfamily)